MTADICRFGLKEHFDFREVHMEVMEPISNIHRAIKESVTPAVLELEETGLINSFHFIFQNDLLLRLSSDDWDAKDDKIRKVLEKHGIPPEFHEMYELPKDHFGGEEGILLCYNNMESNSRLIMGLLDLKDEYNEELDEKLDHLVYSHWVHNLYIQYGINNILQVQYEFKDSLYWIVSLLRAHGDKPQLVEILSKVVREMRRQAELLESQLLPNPFQQEPGRED